MACAEGKLWLMADPDSTKCLISALIILQRRSLSVLISCLFILHRTRCTQWLQTSFDLSQHNIFLLKEIKFGVYSTTPFLSHQHKAVNFQSMKLTKITFKTSDLTSKKTHCASIRKTSPSGCAITRAISHWFRLNTRRVHVGFVVVKVAIGQVFLWELPFSLVNIIPPVLHIRSFVYHWRDLIIVNDIIAKQPAYEIR